MIAACDVSVDDGGRRLVDRRRRAARHDPQRDQLHRHMEAHAVEPLVDGVEIGEGPGRARPSRAPHRR